MAEPDDRFPEMRSPRLPTAACVWQALRRFRNSKHQSPVQYAVWPVPAAPAIDRPLKLGIDAKACGLTPAPVGISTARWRIPPPTS